MHLKLNPVDSVSTVALFIEYMAQQGLRDQSLTNYLPVLKHYFALYNMNTTVTDHRSIRLAIRAVSYNAPLSFTIKGTLTINKLSQLVGKTSHLQHAASLNTYGLLRILSTVNTSSTISICLPNLSHGDVVWGPPGAHIITKCSKNMQVSGQVHVVQLPTLEDSSICPVTALRSIVSTNPDHADQPLFTVATQSGPRILTASKVRSAFRSLVQDIGLPPCRLWLPLTKTIRSLLGL